MLRRRSHAKALVRPALVLVIVAFGVGAGSALVPRDARPLGQFAIAVVGLLLVVWGSIRPFLRWLTTTYTITTRRLITRSGVVRKVGTDVPLTRITNVSYERSLTDRVLGCGTLVLQTTAEGGTLVLRDVSEVEHAHLVLSELIFGPAPEGGGRLPLPREMQR